jgi:hypothetical protein
MLPRHTAAAAKFVSCCSRLVHRGMEAAAWKLAQRFV